MHNQKSSGHSQSVDETNQATSPSNGGVCIDDLMEPAPQGASYFGDKTAMPGVCDHNRHFQMNSQAPPFHANETALDTEIATQVLMAGALGSVNKNPNFPADGRMTSSQGKATATMPPPAPTKPTTSKAAFEAATKANRDLADTALGTQLQAAPLRPA